MQDEWIIVHRGANRQLCSDRALVLHSVGIPYQIVETEDDHVLLVAAANGEKAKFELWQYERENQPAPTIGRLIEPDYEKAVPGIIVYLLIVVTVAWLNGRGAFALDWLGAGRVDGSLVRQGEWWRTITALTLHGGIRHILGNIVFGALFGILAGGLVGPGIAWLSIVIAAAFGNALNVFLLDSAHRSIGASTAVFAALGIVSGFVWRGRFMAQDRWAWRLGPIVGGLALLAYTGTGDENTDVGAHLAGFACGFGAGMLLTRIRDLRTRARAQLVSGAIAVLIVCAAWLVAHLTWN